MICPTTILGQEFAHRSEISAGAGYGNFFDDEGSLGTGPTYRVGTGWRPSGRLQIKAELLGIHHTRHDNFQVGGDSLFVFGNAVYYFSRSCVQPYLFGGLGAHKADFAYSWPATSNGEYHMSKTGLAFRIYASHL